MQSEVSIKELLSGVAIEWKKLGDNDFFEITNKGRKPVKASLRIQGNNPYYGANNMSTVLKRV